MVLHLLLFSTRFLQIEPIHHISYITFSFVCTKHIYLCGQLIHSIFASKYESNGHGWLNDRKNKKATNRNSFSMYDSYPIDVIITKQNLRYLGNDLPNASFDCTGTHHTVHTLCTIVECIEKRKENLIKNTQTVHKSL